MRHCEDRHIALHLVPAACARADPALEDAELATVEEPLRAEGVVEDRRQRVDADRGVREPPVGAPGGEHVLGEAPQRQRPTRQVHRRSGGVLLERCRRCSFPDQVGGDLGVPRWVDQVVGVPAFDLEPVRDGTPVPPHRRNLVGVCPVGVPGDQQSQVDQGLRGRAGLIGLVRVDLVDQRVQRDPVRGPRQHVDHHGGDPHVAALPRQPDPQPVGLPPADQRTAAANPHLRSPLLQPSVEHLRGPGRRPRPGPLPQMPWCSSSLSSSTTTTSNMAASLP